MQLGSKLVVENSKPPRRGLSSFIDTFSELSYNTVRRFDHCGIEYGTAEETA